MADVCDNLSEQQPLIPHRVNIVYGTHSLPSRTAGKQENNVDDYIDIGTHDEKDSYMDFGVSPREDTHSSVLIPTFSGESPYNKKHVEFMDREMSSRFQSRPDGTTLTYDQATNLMITLENTRNVIEHYLHNLEQDQDHSMQVPRRKSWWGQHCWPQKRRWLYRYITIVTVSLQFLNLLILSLLDAWPKPKEERPYVMASAVTMIFLQLINLVFLILASGRLVKQIYRNSVNSVFLAQTYGATILLFAGLYTLTYRLQRHSWRFVNENLYEDPIQVFVLYAKFLFYSISTATLCGSDNVLPAEWFNCLFAGFQMLLSFCYFASILGSAMCHDNSRTSSTTHHRATSPFSISTHHNKHTNNNHNNNNSSINNQYHQNHRPNHHHNNNNHHHHQEQQHQYECQTSAINSNGDIITSTNQPNCFNGHLSLSPSNNNSNHHGNRHHHLCCNSSLLSSPSPTSYSHLSSSSCRSSNRSDQLNELTNYADADTNTTATTKTADDTIIYLSSNSAREVNPTFLPDNSVNVGSRPLAQTNPPTIEVEILNPRHLQVDPKFKKGNILMPSKESQHR